MLKGHRRVLLQAVRALDSRAVDGRSSSDADSTLNNSSSGGYTGPASATALPPASVGASPSPAGGASAAATGPAALARSVSDGSTPARDVGFGGGGLGGDGLGGGWVSDARSHSSPAGGGGGGGGGWDAIPDGGSSRFALLGLGGGCGDFDEEPRSAPPRPAVLSPAPPMVGGRAGAAVPDVASASGGPRSAASGLLVQTGGTGSGAVAAPPSPFASFGRHELSYSEIVMGERVGEGSFGVVRRGTWRGAARARACLCVLECARCVLRHDVAGLLRQAWRSL